MSINRFRSKRMKSIILLIFADAEELLVVKNGFNAFVSSRVK